MTNPEIAVQTARRLFNEGHFWHVHEALESVWLKRQGDEKQLLQGLIMAAAALVHLNQSHEDVAWHLMDEALTRLEGKVPLYYGWDVAAFRTHIQNCRRERRWISCKV